MKCQYCGNDAILPFRCPFCAKYFCSDHRLPENHVCPEIDSLRVQKRVSSEEPLRPGGWKENGIKENGQSINYPFVFKRPKLTSRTELIHLTIGATLVMAVGLAWNSLGIEWIFDIFKNPVVTLGSALIFTFIFISHELAHKFTANYYGSWAEFRISLIGAILTAFSIAPTPIKIVAPGAVMVSGVADRRIIGKTALAGPLMSVVVSCILYIFSFLFPTGLFARNLGISASLAAWISTFNLLPFGIFDGEKIIKWNKAVWLLFFVISVSLVLITIVI